MLIHSCLYYHLNTNIISDKKWDEWAKELVELQSKYPEISEKVTLYKYFKDWDGSTGAFLPITEPWVVAVAESLVKKPSIRTISKPVQKPVIKEKKVVKKKLF